MTPKEFSAKWRAYFARWGLPTSTEWQTNNWGSAFTDCEDFDEFMSDLLNVMAQIAITDENMREV